MSGQFQVVLFSAYVSCFVDVAASLSVHQGYEGILFYINRTVRGNKIIACTPLRAVGPNAAPTCNYIKVVHQVWPQALQSFLTFHSHSDNSISLFPLSIRFT